MKKVSILLPTYNDCDYIERTLESIRIQKYKNWELLICDDGSVDNTKNVVKNYIRKYKMNNKIQYFYQENSDQLNAIINLLKYATGDYVYILHSDDLLYDENTISNCVGFIENSDADVIISDLSVIDKNDNIIGIQKLYKYKKNENVIPLQLLWLGRNLYNDCPFSKMSVFKKEIFDNYLIWNGPFWLNVNKNSILNVRNVNFYIRKYRVYDGNYINTPSSKLNVINGEIRVITNLLAKYYIPFYKIQYYIFRIINKLKLTDYYHPFYMKCEEKNKYKIVKFVLNKRFTNNEINNNLFLKSLLGFYKNNNSNRKIKINIPNGIPLYYGKDMRIFNNKILNNKLEKFYLDLLKDIEIGINTIEVCNNKQKEKMIDITKFLCIYPFVNIVVKNNK